MTHWWFQGLNRVCPTPNTRVLCLRGGYKADGESSASPLVSAREAEKETFSPDKVPRRGSKAWLLRAPANQNSEFPLECSFLGGDNRIIGTLLASCKMMTDKESLEVRVI